MSRIVADPGAPGLSLRLPNRKDSLDEARSALHAYVDGSCMTMKAMNRVEVILEELVTNVARHAQEADTIWIEATLGDAELALMVADNGAPFNPLDVPEPAKFTSLEAATLGGQGLPLIKRLSRSARYDRSDGFNRLTVVIAAA